MKISRADLAGFPSTPSGVLRTGTKIHAQRRHLCANQPCNGLPCQVQIGIHAAPCLGSTHAMGNDLHVRKRSVDITLCRAQHSVNCVYDSQRTALPSNGRCLACTQPEGCSLMPYEPHHACLHASMHQLSLLLIQQHPSACPYKRRCSTHSLHRPSRPKTLLQAFKAVSSRTAWVVLSLGAIRGWAFLITMNLSSSRTRNTSTPCQPY